MQTSVRFVIQYPSADRSDTADVPRDFISIVNGIEANSAMYGQGTFALRPTSSGGSPGKQGRFYMATDLTPHVLYYDFGTGWDTVGSVTAGSVRGSDNADVQREILQGSIRRIDLSTQLKPSGAAVDADEALRALGTAAGNAAPGNTLATLLRQGGAQELTHRVVNALGIFEPGIGAQLRAGRVLAATDFTTLLGLSAPVGLYNLSDATDASGNARNLSNKGAVPFGSGILGAATEAALFAGSTAQALYIADAGAGDPFRIAFGSFGFWMRTAKSGVIQDIITKTLVAQTSGYVLGLQTTNAVRFILDNTIVNGVTAIADDRWHFVVATYDGATMSVYVDGALDGSGTPLSGPIVYAGAYPFNIGGATADGATAAINPFFGRVDEAFVTPDVLSLEQVRMLYAAKVAHGFAVAPNRAQVNVRRRKRGGALTAAPFSVQPLHLYDFTAGSLADAGSLANALTNNGPAPVAPGADGALGNAFNFSGAQYLSATDAGLPAAAASGTFGVWLKSSQASDTQYAISYGTAVGGARALIMQGASKQFTFYDGTTNFSVNDQRAADGQWHFVVVVIDSAPGDGLKIKLYVDGRLIGSWTNTISNTVLAGANALRIGQFVNGGGNFTGQLDAPFLTGYAMSADEVAKLYANGSLQMLASPKNEGDHVEAVDATNVYLICDTLDSQNLIDVLVAA